MKIRQLTLVKDFSLSCISRSSIIKGRLKNELDYWSWMKNIHNLMWKFLALDLSFLDRYNDRSFLGQSLRFLKSQSMFDMKISNGLKKFGVIWRQKDNLISSEFWEFKQNILIDIFEAHFQTIADEWSTWIFTRMVEKFPNWSKR